MSEEQDLEKQTQVVAEADRKRTGFGAMPAVKQRELASKGGRAAHASGKGHQFTPGPDGTAAAAARKASHVTGAARRRDIGAEVGRVGKPDEPEGAR